MLVDTVRNTKDDKPGAVSCQSARMSEKFFFDQIDLHKALYTPGFTQGSLCTMNLYNDLHNRVVRFVV